MEHRILGRAAARRGFQFETSVAELFSALGYAVTEEPQIGLADIDLLVEKGGNRFPVEVFIGRSQSTMSRLRTVAERLHSIADTIEGMSKPIIVAGLEVAPEAKIWAQKELDVTVWDANDLAELAAPFPDIAAKLRTILKIEPEPKGISDGRKEDLEARLRRHIDVNGLSPSGYEDLCKEVFIKLFDPDLYGFEKQARTTDNGNRYDFICRIKPGNQFWNSLRQDFRTKAILFECKNYTEQIGPDQVYSTERYLFSGALRTVCFLVARLGANDAAVRAAQGAMRESGKLIVLLSNTDLIAMLKLNAQPGAAEEFLDKRIWDFIISLPR